MAKTIDTTAEKKRRQTKILIVLGVALLAVLAIQGPKLLKGSGSSTPAAAPATDGETTPASATTSTPAVVTTTAAAGSTPTTTAPVVPAGSPRTVLVGVTVGGGLVPKPGEGQLRAFTLFTQKDPFVQRLPQTPVSTGAAAPSSGASGTGSEGGGDSTSAPTPVPPSYATIAVNGDAEPLAVKDLFPEKEQVFVLVSVKGKTAKIAVSGGAFTDGQTITLKLGKNLTLVNTATGARYALKLLYVGDEPEQVEGFTAKPAAEPKK